MLEQQGMLAVLAVVIGVAAGLVLFVPFIWASYRRRGGITARRFTLWAAALVYFWAIWVYTLLPLPDPNKLKCAGVNLNPALFVTEIREAIQTSAGSLWSFALQPTMLQLALNVLLFIPLGFFLRLLFQRGWLTALLVGAGISLFVETTQITGVWGLYSCAYRVFDVNDMMTNTFGAVLGSVLALGIPLRWRSAERALPPESPRPVTKPRRLLAMVTDLIGFSVVSGAVAIAVQAILVFGLDKRDFALASDTSSQLGTAVGFIAWFGLVLATGRTVGDHAVRLRYIAGPLPQLLARILRFFGGIGLYAGLLLLANPWVGWSTVFAILALACTLFTSSGRGLPALLSRQNLVDDRETFSEELIQK